MPDPVGKDVRERPPHLPGAPAEQLFQRGAALLRLRRQRHGKFPHIRQHALRGPPVKQEPAVPLHDGARRLPLRLGLLLRPHRKLRLDAQPRRLAEPPQGTGRAPGMLRDAHLRSQIHERFIEIPRPVSGDRLLRQLCDVLPAGALQDILPHRIEPGIHAEHIAVHCGALLPVGDGRHRSGRVVADARQRPDGLRVPGHHAAVLLRDDLRRLVDIPRPAVIAQPLPSMEHLRLIGGGHVGNGGKPLHPCREIGLYRLRPRLLEHDLRDPYMIGIPRLRFPPRQVPPVRVEPRQQHPGPVISFQEAPPEIPWPSRGRHPPQNTPSRGASFRRAPWAARSCPPPTSPHREAPPA